MTAFAIVAAAGRAGRPARPPHLPSTSMRPDPELVEHFRTVLASKPADILGGYALGYMSASIRQAAEDHDRHCAGCSTCYELRRLLAFVLAYELNEAPPDLLRRIHGIDDET